MRAAGKKGPRGLALMLALLLSGCTVPPAASPTPEPTPEPTLSPVYTDWSKLEPYVPEDREEVYVRYWGEPRFDLTPSPDYGPLVTFQGTAMTGKAMWGEEVSDYGWTDRLYGLMTTEGKVVVEPIYIDVTGVVVKDEAGRYDTFPGAKIYTQYAADSPTRYRYTLCAADGSWTTGPVFFAMDSPIGDFYEYYEGYSGYDGEALFGLREDGELVLLDPRTGREKASFPLPDYETINYFYADLGEDLVTVACYYGDDYSTPRLFCWDLAGNAISIPEEVVGLSPYSEGLALAYTDGGYGYIDREGRWVISPQYSYADSFEKGRALVRKTGEGYLFINPAGKPLTEAINTDHVSQTGEYWIFTGYEGDAGLVLDGDLQPINSPLLHQGYVSAIDYGWATVETDGGTLLVKGEESWPFPAGFYSYISRADTRENSVLLDREDSDGNYEQWLWTPASGELAPLPADNSHNRRFSRDIVTGKAYRRIYSDSYGTVEIQDAGGKVLFRAKDCQDFYGDTWPTLVGGSCLCESYDGGAFTTVLLSPRGKVLMKKYWEDGLD